MTDFLEPVTTRVLRSTFRKNELPRTVHGFVASERLQRARIHKFAESLPVISHNAKTTDRN